MTVSQISHRSLTLVLGITLIVATIGCGDDLPSESDLPSEADLAYPGAIKVDRFFDDGETGTYIDGGSAYRSPRLKLTYQLDGASNQEVLDWYSNELGDLGWVVDYEEGTRSVGFDLDPEGDLNFGYGVTARVDTSGEYDVVVVVSRDD